MLWGRAVGHEFGTLTTANWAACCIWIDRVHEYIAHHIKFPVSFSEWGTHNTIHTDIGHKHGERERCECWVHERMNDKWCHWTLGRESNSFWFCMRLANWSVRSNDPLSILYPPACPPQLTSNQRQETAHPIRHITHGYSVYCTRNENGERLM